MVVDMQEQVEENGWDRGTGWGADSKGSGSEEEEEDDWWFGMNFFDIILTLFNPISTLF